VALGGIEVAALVEEDGAEQGEEGVEDVRLREKKEFSKINNPFR
jgi:hypothetical protein